MRAAAQGQRRLPISRLSSFPEPLGRPGCVNCQHIHLLGPVPPSQASYPAVLGRHYTRLETASLP